MTPNTRFYNLNAKYDKERSFSKWIKAGVLTEDDCKIMRRYVAQLQARQHITDGRVNKIVFTLIQWRRFLPLEWRMITMDSIYDAVTSLKNGKNTLGQPYKPNTLRDFVKILKPYIIWLNDEGITSIPENKLKGIKAPAGDYEVTTPDELLSSEDIGALIGACLNNRDRALIAILYESGARIGEITQLCWKDILFDEYGAKLYIEDTKTHKKRYGRLIKSVDLVSKWKASYPGKASGDKFVFVCVEGEVKPLAYHNVIKLIRKAANRAGITKEVRPHLFRKSRITEMVRQNYQESIIKQAMWGNLSTAQFKTYVRLGEQDIDREYLRKAGVARVEKTLQPVRPELSRESVALLKEFEEKLLMLEARKIKS